MYERGKRGDEQKTDHSFRYRVFAAHNGKLGSDAEVADVLDLELRNVNYNIDIYRAAGRIGTLSFCFSFIFPHASSLTLLLSYLSLSLVSRQFFSYISGPPYFIWVRPDTFTKLTALKAATSSAAQVCPHPIQ